MAPQSYSWGAWADGMAGVVSFGPFLPEPGDDDDGRKAAERFCADRPGTHHLVNLVENRRSPCGPWLP